MLHFNLESAVPRISLVLLLALCTTSENALPNPHAPKTISYQLSNYELIDHPHPKFPNRHSARKNLLSATLQKPSKIALSTPLTLQKSSNPNNPNSFHAKLKWRYT
jgi:hypothetical protein